MKLKYELIESDNKDKGPYRVRALRDIGSDPNYPLIAKGDIGGYVHNLFNLDQGGECWVGDNASVSPECRVVDNAVVSGHATLTGGCYVSNTAQIRGLAKAHHAHLYDRAQISGHTTVTNSTLLEDAQIFGNATVTLASLGGGVRLEAGAVSGRECYGLLSLHNGLQVRHPDVSIETRDHQIVIQTVYGPLCIVRTVRTGVVGYRTGVVGYRMTVGCQTSTFGGLIRLAKRNHSRGSGDSGLGSYVLLARGLQAWVEPLLREWGVEGDLEDAGGPGVSVLGDSDDDD